MKLIHHCTFVLKIQEEIGFMVSYRRQENIQFVIRTDCTIPFDIPIILPCLKHAVISFEWHTIKNNLWRSTPDYHLIGIPWICLNNIGAIQHCRSKLRNLTCSQISELLKIIQIDNYIWILYFILLFEIVFVELIIKQ